MLTPSSLVFYPVRVDFLGLLFSKSNFLTPGLVHVIITCE